MDYYTIVSIALTLMNSKCFGYYERKLLPNLTTTHTFVSLEKSCFQTNQSPVPLNRLIFKIAIFYFVRSSFSNCWVIKLQPEDTGNSFHGIALGSILCKIPVAPLNRRFSVSLFSVMWYLAASFKKSS